MFIEILDGFPYISIMVHIHCMPCLFLGGFFWGGGGREVWMCGFWYNVFRYLVYVCRLTTTMNVKTQVVLLMLCSFPIVSEKTKLIFLVSISKNHSKQFHRILIDYVLLKSQYSHNILRHVSYHWITNSHRNSNSKPGSWHRYFLLTPNL